jgi:GNAT superfamily N-acetyltransferase
MSLPPTLYLNIREEHLPLLTHHYDFGASVHAMWRMVLVTPQRPASPSRQSPVRLGVADAPRIRTLYAHGGDYTPDAFDAYQLNDGVFFGIPAADGGLLAVGGTHIIDWTSSIAAIGNMYTRPDQRGQGHASAILAAIVATLQTAGIQTIVLNVDQRNHTACQLYERCGFQIHTSFLEGVGVRLT